MRIVQLLPTMAFGDAVSNDTAAIRQLVSEMGYDTAIYASNVDPRLPKGTAAHWKKMPELRDSDLLIYHGSTGDPLNRMVSSFGGRKMMIYHNITPPSFFRGYSREAQELTQNGYEQIRALSDVFRYCVADSDYNRQDLRKMEYTCPIDVCPIMIPFEDYDRKPDEAVIRKYRGDGWTNLLFVGRIAPNKRQENVIRAFYHYHHHYNPKSRLFLVGSDTGMERYRHQLDNYVQALGLQDTLGTGGLLLDSNDSVFAAAAIDRIIRDDDLRSCIAAQQKRQLARFRYDHVSAKMKECILKLAGES